MSHRRCLLLALLALAACPSPNDKPDGGDGLPLDECNNLEEALSLPQCELALGQQVERYISTESDQDWYSFRLPATAGPRTLVRVTAGYVVPSTAVNLSVNLLREDGRASLGRKVDAHGQGAPKPVEILLPFGEPGARLVLLVKDEPAIPDRPNFDAKAPYLLKVEVQDNPDTNEPNDTTPTPLPLSNASGGGQEGTGTGYLATADDVDRFSFNLPAGKVAHVRLTAPKLTPPPPYRLSYKLLRPDGTAESEGQVLNEFLAPDLATARKVKTAGPWQVVVQAYRSPNTTGPIPGDLRLKYDLTVRVLDEADPSELSNDNDALLRASAVSVAGGPGPSTVVSFIGRLGAVPDPDWYAVDLPANTQPTVLRYRVVPLASGGRFSPLPGPQDREVLAFTRVPGDDRQACANSATTCPKGYAAQDTTTRDVVLAWCNSTAGALCLQSSRDEDVSVLPGLRNFEGALPVPPHNATLRYFFLVQDSGNNWADDKDYRLEVRWLTDADEAARFSGGAEQPTPKPLANDATNGATFPAPPTGTAYEVRGTLSHGFGRLVQFDPTRGQGVRGPVDYDAVPTDVDTYTFQLPTDLLPPLDRTWELQWDVDKLSDGGTAHELALDLTFCDGDDGGTCTPVSTGSRGAPLTLAYRPDPLRAWHSPAGSLGNLQPLFSRTETSTTTRVTVQPYACSCLEPRFIRGGTLRVAVSAVDRKDYEPVSYTLRTAHTTYPRTYGLTDGGSASCPAADGGTPGCVFTRQP